MGLLKRAEPGLTHLPGFIPPALVFFCCCCPSFFFFFFDSLAKIAQQDAAPAAPRCCSHGSPQPWPGCRMHTHSHHLQRTHCQGNKLQAIFKGSQAGKDTRPMSKKSPPGPPLPSVGVTLLPPVPPEGWAITGLTSHLQPSDSTQGLSSRLVSHN